MALFTRWWWFGVHKWNILAPKFLASMINKIVLWNQKWLQRPENGVVIEALLGRQPPSVLGWATIPDNASRDNRLTRDEERQGNWQPIEMETQRPHPRRRKGEHKSKLHEEFAWASAERPRHFIVTWDTLKEMNNHWYLAFQANEKVRRNGFFQRISKKRRFREQCGLAQGLFRRFVWQLAIQRVTQEWLNLKGGNFQVTRERRIGLVNCI